MDLRLPFAAVAALAALPVLAMTCRAESGERVVPVVELYTSEGCSSCPPAVAGAATFGLTLPRAAPAGSHPMLVALVQDARRGDVLQSVALDLEGCER